MAEPIAGVRTSWVSVMNIIDTELDYSTVNAFINSAHRMVESNLAGKGLSEETLGEIELWLAAHLLSARDPRKKSVKVDDLQVTYQGESGMGLKATFYGQQALALDTSNTLASMGQKRAVIQAE